MYARLDSASAHLMTEDDDDDDSAVFDLFLPFRSTAFLSGISELPLEPLLGDCDCLSLSLSSPAQCHRPPARCWPRAIQTIYVERPFQMVDPPLTSQFLVLL